MRGDDHPDTLILIEDLLALYIDWDKPEKAAEWRSKQLLRTEKGQPGS